jgi:Glyoxalase-like domain
MPIEPINTTAIADIDHLMIATFDHDSVIKAYTELGFKVRPVRQLLPMGGGSAGGNGGSAAILLRARTAGCANYLELAMADPITAMPIMQDILCRAEGPAMLVHATLDPDQLASEWIALGVDMQRVKLTLTPFGEGPPIDLEVFLVPKGQAPFAFNACWYSSPYDFEREEWRDHPNGALHWTGFSFPVDDVSFDYSIKRFSKLYGMSPFGFDDDCATFRLGKTELTIWNRTAFHSKYGSEADGGLVHIAVRSLSYLQTFFFERQIEFAALDSVIKVGGCYANGTHLLFEQAED